jgi:hypothetical protein
MPRRRIALGNVRLRCMQMVSSDMVGDKMRTPPKNAEFSRFTAAVRDILKVSKSEMRRRIEEQKENGKRLSKGASLGSAASSKIRSSFGSS